MSELTFWFNAFIPKTMPLYTRVLTAGPHAFRTAVPLPVVARSWPGNAFKDWNAGYLTDQRGFDDRFGASHRMCSFVKIDTDAMAVLEWGHSTSGTTEVNLVTGVQTGFAKADLYRCKWSRDFAGESIDAWSARQPSQSGSGNPAANAKTIRFKLVGAAGDPLVGMAADIDYNGVVAIRVSPDSIDVGFSGEIDSFPAYDCYARLADTTKALFRISPPPGRTVTSLLGSASTLVKASVSFPIAHASRIVR